MTPAEAREIDRLEFEAERAAIRQRAYALVRQPNAKAQPVAPVTQARPSMPIVEQRPKPVVKPASTARQHVKSSSPIGRPAYRYTAHGVTLPLTEWAVRLNMTVSGLHQRIHKGWTFEEIVSTPRGQRRPSKMVAH